MPCMLQQLSSLGRPAVRAGALPCGACPALPLACHRRAGSCSCRMPTRPGKSSTHQPLTPHTLALPSTLPSLQHFCLYPAHAEGQFWQEPTPQQQQQQHPGGHKKGLPSSATQSVGSSSSSGGPSTPSPSAGALAAPAATLAAAASDADLEAARHGIEPAAEQEQAPLLRR